MPSSPAKQPRGSLVPVPEKILTRTQYNEQRDSSSEQDEADEDEDGDPANTPQASFYLPYHYGEYRWSSRRLETFESSGQAGPPRSGVQSAGLTAVRKQFHSLARSVLQRLKTQLDGENSPTEESQGQKREGSLAFYKKITHWSFTSQPHGLSMTN